MRRRRGLVCSQLRSWRLAYQPSQLAVFAVRASLEVSKWRSGCFGSWGDLRPTRACRTRAQAWCFALHSAYLTIGGRMRRGLERADLGDASVSSFYRRFAPGVRRGSLMQRPSAMQAGRRHGPIAAPITRRARPSPEDRAGRSRSRWRHSADRAPHIPSVFLLGGEKCGSTSLAVALSRHPQIQMARHALPGEPAFFRGSPLLRRRPPLHKRARLLRLALPALRAQHAVVGGSTAGAVGTAGEAGESAAAARS